MVRPPLIGLRLRVTQYRLPPACVLLALMLVLPLPVQAAFNPALWGLCPPDILADQITEYTGADRSEAPVDVIADSAISGPVEALLEGDVEVRRGDERLRAERLTLDRQTNQVRALGALLYGDPQLAVRAEGGMLDLDTNFATFESADYYHAGRNAQGSAEGIEIDQEAGLARLARATYSTCARGEEFWQLRASELALDEERGRGEAWHINVALAGRPVLYLPYLSFPIDDERHSGFLVPGAGYDSESGFDLRLPYYWNIAPDRDATFAPRIFTRRGLQLGAEYRWLKPDARGTVQAEVLPADQVYGSTRWGTRITHQSNYRPRLYTDLLYQQVSDDDYLRDLSNNLDLTDPTFVERRFDTRYFGTGWNVLARLQKYQTLDEETFRNEPPYARLPQILFNGRWPLYGPLRAGLRSEFVRFDHPDQVYGSRADLYPHVALDLERPWGFVRPRAAYRFTTYDLDRTAPDDARRPSRSAPVLSMDSGLVFERPIDWGWLGGAAVQTLEPRLFYLYVPYRNQDDLPLFDTDDIDRGYAWLFLDNRFVGADRLGDANQITAALTSRVLGAQDGRERARLSLGQIYYFDPPRVGLTGELDRRTRSELIAEGALRLSRNLDARGALHWDTTEGDSSRLSLDLRYRPDEDRIANLAYRFARDELEQIDVGLLWRINPRWRAMARWNYSLLDARIVDTFAGFEYGDCCWALRMVARHNRPRPDDRDAKNSIYLELELKGLAGLGTNIDGLLENAIIGYQRTRY